MRVAHQIRHHRPFAVNYLLAFDPVTRPVALDASAPIIQFAWGIPTRDAVAAVRNRGARLGIQIGSAAGARRALDIVRDDQGCIAEMALFAGQGVEAIRDIPSAGELVTRLWKECLDVT